MLTYEQELSVSPNQPIPLQDLLRSPGDVEGSSSSEGSHETGDSGRYSHDETELANLSSGPNSRPLTPTSEDRGDGGRSAAEPSELSEENHTDLKGKMSFDSGCSHQEAHSSSQSALCV